MNFHEQLSGFLNYAFGDVSGLSLLVSGGVQIVGSQWRLPEAATWNRMFLPVR